MNPATMPYPFVGPYSGCYADAEGAMDKRHVFMVHELLKTWPFQNVLELGSYNGASSTAFIEAMNAGAKFRATFCDIAPRPSLRDVLCNCRTPNARLTSEKSWDVLATWEYFDFVLVDAYHDAESVGRELAGLLTRRPVCIMAHDTSATANGYKKSEGAANLAKTIRELPGYFNEPFYRCLEDNAKREGERTERGLFFATTNPRLFDLAEAIFNDWQ